MADAEQSVLTSVVARRWFVEAWEAARPRAIVTLSEFIGNLVLLFCFAIFYLFLRLLVLVGVSVDDVAFLGKADLWAVKAVYLTSLFVFVGQSVLGAWSSLKSEGK